MVLRDQKVLDLVALFKSVVIYFNRVNIIGSSSGVNYYFNVNSYLKSDGKRKIKIVIVTVEVSRRRSDGGGKSGI